MSDDRGSGTLLALVSGAVILAAGNAAVIGSSCYDPLRKRG